MASQIGCYTAEPKRDWPNRAFIVNALKWGDDTGRYGQIRGSRAGRPEPAMRAAGFEPATLAL